jgi:hypothetical protein
MGLAGIAIEASLAQHGRAAAIIREFGFSAARRAGIS